LTTKNLNFATQQHYTCSFNVSISVSRSCALKPLMFEDLKILALWVSGTFFQLTASF